MATSASRRAGKTSPPDALLTGLGSRDAARLIDAAADIALFLDDQGRISHAALDAAALGLAPADAWIGRAWIDTVRADSRDKVAALLDADQSESAPQWREINHSGPHGDLATFLYTVVPIGDDGRRVALGRDLRPLADLQQRLVDAHQALERDYGRLRQVETRYRLLFQSATEPTLIADAGSGRVLEANPSAAKLFGRSAKSLVGRPFAERFAAESQEPLRAAMEKTRATGKPRRVRVRLEGDAAEIGVALALFRQEGGALFLLRVAPAAPAIGAARPTEGEVAEGGPALAALAEAPDAFVVADAEGRIVYANAAFLDLTQLASEEQALGEPLRRWLGRSGVDFDLLMSRVRDAGSVRAYQTLLRGEFGSDEEIEVSAGTATWTGGAGVGLNLRRVTRVALGPSGGAASGGDAPVFSRSATQLRDLVGRVPLKDLVRETTDTIERLCIEAALEITGDNRASAADMLGLSRQSLYVKMRRYGLGDLDGDADD